MKRWRVSVEPAEFNGAVVWVARVRGPGVDLEWIDPCGADALAYAVETVRANRAAFRAMREMLN